jgi:D-amino-acid dehydrogenase
MKYDAIVIGGGIVGISTAYHLVRSGIKTLVVDRRDKGRATDAGAGIISPGGNPGHHDPYYRFVGLAEVHYSDLIRDLADDGVTETGYAVCGSLLVAVDDRESAEFERSTTGFPAGDGRDPVKPVVVSPDRARELFPPLGEVTGALFSPTAARVDGRQLAAALESAAVGRGLTVETRSVTDIRSSNDGVQVTVEGEVVSSGNLVIAGGAWSQSFSDQLEVSIPVGPQRGQILHLDLGETDTSSWPIISGMGEHYMVPWPDHRVVVGATREANAGFNPVTTVEGLMEVMYEAIRVAPGLRTASIREIRVGLRPLSQDGMPVIGPLPRHPRIHLVTGHGPMGLHLGPFSGKVVADAIYSGSWPSEWAAFGVERFL